VHHGKAAGGDEIDARLGGVENRLADVDLDLGLVGVDISELRTDRGVRLVYLPEPQWGVTDGLKDVVQFGRFGEPVPLQIHRPRVVVPPFAVEPVAVNLVAVGIEIAEKAVGDDDVPHAVLNFLPAGNHFRAFDHDLFSRFGTVHDSVRVGFATARRCNLLAIGSLMHGDDVAGLCNFRCL